jgi:Flp pilus assembly protein TadG
MRTITERSDQQGQAVIQMAIALPILLVLLLSIWQLSVVYGTWRTLHDAASRGARAGAAARHGHHQAAARAAAMAAAGDVALKRVSLTARKSHGTAVYTATACSSYAVNLLGIVVKSGDLCRDATMRAG